jgi:hypothetical protein
MYNRLTAWITARRVSALTCRCPQFGNDCTKGGTTVVGRLTGSNLPPGQETNIPVDDRGNGTYILHLVIKSPSEARAAHGSNGDPPTLFL